ncbi:hypothetical protein ABKA04_001242 [Annulohypoxylon sp. FPYF3050]
MATVIPIEISEKSIIADDAELGPSEERIADVVPPLGTLETHKRLWFQRSKQHSLNDIATQPSVYDNPDIASQYKPREDWENLHRFDPKARWTWAEERKVVWKVDWRIMAWTAIMFTAMELDRANLAQSLTDNFLEDMHMTTDDYNLGNTIYALCFLAGEFPAQLLAKWLGPDRWIPSQIVLFSVVSASQFALSSRSSFLVCRALLALLQGGFIPECVLYLSYFYKHHELTIRLGFFWTGMFIADIVAAIVAFGILHMRGVEGRSGWRWLFLIEGLITGIIGLLSFIMMPPGPTETASWSRGKNGWFTERPLYAIGLTFNIPTFSPQQYLSLSLRGLGFDTFQTNLLSIPYLVLKIINMIALATLAEYTGQLAAYNKSVEMVNVGDNLLIDSGPTRSSGSSAALYNMFLQAGVIISSNIYRSDDAPLYRRGNSILLGIVGLNLVLYVLAKTYYVWRNRERDHKWNAMTSEEKLVYLADHQDAGNKRLDFRLAS